MIFRFAYIYREHSSSLNWHKPHHALTHISSPQDWSSYTLNKYLTVEKSLFTFTVVNFSRPTKTGNYSDFIIIYVELDRALDLT